MSKDVIERICQLTRELDLSNQRLLTPTAVFGTYVLPNVPSMGAVFKNTALRTSSQDAGIGKHSFPPWITTAKITIRLQNNYHPELSENWAVRKSNKQGIKQVTVIQTGSRDRDADLEQAVPHLHVVDKKLRGYLGSKGSQLHTRPPSPGFKFQEVKSL